MAYCPPSEDRIQLAHVGDSAALLVRGEEVTILTMEHTVAARMVADKWQDANEAIPPSAHHTLTQCIGQDLYIDPQIVEAWVQEGDRIFLVTDGITKALPESTLFKCLTGKAPIDKICHSITFQVEAAGSPDNYTIVGVQF
jgi:protein phosphatase